MLIGDPLKLAIELGSFTREGGNIWCSTCYRAENDRIGDFDKTTILGAVSSSFSRLQQHQANRRSDVLWPLPAPDLLARCYGGLYIDTGQNDDQVSDDWNLIKPHMAMPFGLEPFDGWAAFIVEHDTVARFIWAKLDDASPLSNSCVREIRIPVGYFDALLTEFQNKIQGL